MRVEPSSLAVRRSTFGHRLLAMKDSPAACATLGMNVVRMKLSVFMLSTGIAGLGGLVLTLGLEPALIKSGVLMFETMTRYELGTLPLFMLMAHLCFVAGASGDFFGVAARLFGHRRGGLARFALGSGVGD